MELEGFGLFYFLKEALIDINITPFYLSVSCRHQVYTLPGVFSSTFLYSLPQILLSVMT